MRDFRDAKAMAHTLRAALAARGLTITNSQSLELIAEAFGAADWNTLAAAIRGEALVARNSVTPLPPSIADSDPMLPFSARLLATLHRALVYATQRKHEYATLEHLLLALTDDADAAAVLRSCNVELGTLREKLAAYLDEGLKRLVIDSGAAPKPTAAFQRVVQRAGPNARESGGAAVTGADVLIAIFSETQNPAARLLGEQGVTRESAVSFIAQGTGTSPP